jgi:hypothetical protein
MHFTKEGPKYILEHGKATSMPIIGHKFSSETQRPAVYTKGKLRFVDLPGLEDTKGPQQEIINSYTSSLVFKKGRHCRLVLVLEVASLYSSRGGKLAELLTRMEGMFGKEFLSLAQSSCLVISKVDSAVYSE